MIANKIGKKECENLKRKTEEKITSLQKFKLNWKQ